MAGIPGCLLANFTWADIYAPYARAAGGDANRLVAELRQAYRQATIVFRAEPAMRMSWLPGQVNVGMVANPGRDRRAELRRVLGLAGTEKLVYFYVGRYGQNDLHWANLEKYAGQGVHFVGYYPPPVGPLKNVHVVPSADWPGSDLIASTDALVAKAGYGTACEAMARGTPMVYPPRRGFSEFRALDRSLRAGAAASRSPRATSSHCGSIEPSIVPSISPRFPRHFPSTVPLALPGTLSGSASRPEPVAVRKRRVEAKLVRDRRRLFSRPLEVLVVVGASTTTRKIADPPSHSPPFSVAAPWMLGRE